ncbi:MAG: hypothetical protein Q4D02_01890 [Clostridia bacterium]|nr:hypothetical protein [Clostridia bacterium]
MKVKVNLKDKQTINNIKDILFILIVIFLLILIVGQTAIQEQHTEIKARYEQIKEYNTLLIKKNNELNDYIETLIKKANEQDSRSNNLDTRY